MIHKSFECPNNNNNILCTVFDRPNDDGKINCFLRRVVLRNGISLFTGVESRVTFMDLGGLQAKSSGSKILNIW